MKKMIQQSTEKYEWARIANIEESIYSINIIAKPNFYMEETTVPTVEISCHPTKYYNEKEMNKVAEKCLAFLSGLNLQDHSVEDQRKQREIIKDLMHAINPGKASK